MNRKELRVRVERSLQDLENKRWNDSELNGYIDDAQMEFCRITKTPKVDSSEDLVTVSSPNRQTSCDLTVSSKTVTITTVSDHGFSVGDSVLISESAYNTRNGGHLIIDVPSNSPNSFRYLLDTAETEGTSELYDAEEGTGGVTVQKTGPVITKPSTILEVSSVSVDGKELQIHTENEMNHSSNRAFRKSSHLMTSLGMTQSPFGLSDVTFNVPKWKEVEGYLDAVVINERTQADFRLYPLPSKPEHVYIDKDASSMVSQKIVVRGVRKPTALSLDTTSPIIAESYHEALVYGALERAYLKESQLRNVEKAQAYRYKFMELAGSALQNEGLNSNMLSGGRNQGYMRVWR